MLAKDAAWWVLRRPGTPLLDAIAGHKKALVKKRRAQRSDRFWSPLRMILTPFVSSHPESTLRAVISAAPADADEALDKVLYLMAVVLSESECLDPVQVQRAAASLAPFRPATLAALIAVEHDDAGAQLQTAAPGNADLST